jgi:hypothetical protein
MDRVKENEVDYERINKGNIFQEKKFGYHLFNFTI